MGNMSAKEFSDQAVTVNNRFKKKLSKISHIHKNGKCLNIIYL